MLVGEDGMKIHGRLWEAAPEDGSESDWSGKQRNYRSKEKGKYRDYKLP